MSVSSLSFNGHILLHVSMLMLIQQQGGSDVSNKHDVGWRKSEEAVIMYLAQPLEGFGECYNVTVNIIFYIWDVKYHHFILSGIWTWKCSTIPELGLKTCFVKSATLTSEHQNLIGSSLNSCGH